MRNAYTGVANVCVLNAPAAAEAAIIKGQIIGRGINWGRTVANTPANLMTPELFYQSAAAYLGSKVSLRTATAAETKGMGLFNGVAQASAHKPAFIIAEYNGGRRRNVRACSSAKASPSIPAA